MKKFKDSNEFKGKPVKIGYEGNENPLECIIDTIEEGGIIVHYWTEGDDSTSVCDEHDDEAVVTQTYIPWTSLYFIDYRDDDEYPS
jgi:hypothetical protein